MIPLILILLFADPYEALRSRRYDDAIAAFQQLISVEPSKAGLRKDLAYTLLKVGENERARDQFGEAMRLDPTDEQAAMEYAFLCYETKRQAEARRVFARLHNPTAEQAFRNIDAPLAQGIERWKKALEFSPENFSAHEELARLADQRDDFALAAEHYQRAWKLKPEEGGLLLDLGRVWRQLGRVQEANAALLAASRGREPRVAERARELLPARYPFVYEFQRALELDPSSLGLRRELAYLLLAMGQPEEAEAEFRTIVRSSPDDLLSVAQLGFLRLAQKDLAGASPLFDRVLKGGDEELADRVRSALKMPQTLKRRAETQEQRTLREAKTLADRSLEAGYLKDALKYLTVAHESDPVDFTVMLKLGWTYNILKQDRDAVRWFNLARKSPDAAVAVEADRAYHNISPALARFRTTAWALPFFSSRWHDVFAYGQVKTEVKLGKLPLHAYVSTRLVGDTRGTLNGGNPGVAPQYLSESAVIFGLGVSTNAWHGATGWFEAGEALRYRGEDSGHIYAGLSRRSVIQQRRGPFNGFVEERIVCRHQRRCRVHEPFRARPAAVFTESSRLHPALLRERRHSGSAVLELSRDRGFAAPVLGELCRNRAWRAAAACCDIARAAVYGERAAGNYLVQEGNPRGPLFYDLRAGLWYAFSR